MPLVAQVTGAVALTALIVGPWWASAPDAIPTNSETTAATPATVTTPAPTAPAPTAPAVATSTPAVPVRTEPAAPAPAPVVAARPAHLNLDVRHSFGSVDFSVTVDGKPALNTKLAGSGKRFGVFGKRSERGYTKTLDLAPGAHLVRVRVMSTADKFDQARVERFDLGSASVATIRIAADKTGLSLAAERPPAPPVTTVAETVAPAPPPPAAAPAPVMVPIQAATVPVPQATVASRQDVNAVADLLQSVRSMLIAIAGFVASAATGFVVQEYLRSRPLPFAKPTAGGSAPASQRRGRRRPAKPEPEPVNEDDFEDDEVLPAGDREPT